MITIAYLYYNNKELFNKVKHYYSQFDVPYKFIFIDDGSKDEPLEVTDMPIDWELYRIEQDLRWNYNGARNLCMTVAPTNWVFCIDLDHVITEKLLFDLPELIKNNKNTLYRFNRLHMKSGLEKPHGSSYLVHKKFFWKKGGYQEDTTGYGQDAKFAARIGKQNIVTLKDYYIDNIEIDGSPEWVNEQKQSNPAWRNVHNPNYPDRDILRFDWERLI